jgi:riboflavin synthase
MFTGIIEGTGKLVEKRKAGGGLVFVIEASFDLKDPQEGESIAVNGVCLTAYEIRGRRFCADVSPETLSRSILGELAVGAVVNLERALRLSDRLGGHIVSGHVDCIAHVKELSHLGDFTLFTFTLAKEQARYIIEKGSVTINGISLTVNSCDATSFTVSIIPHTLQVTTLGGLEAGSRVNIEVDIIGKYVEKLLGGGKDGKRSAMTAGFLAEHGFF